MAESEASAEGLVEQGEEQDDGGEMIEDVVGEVDDMGDDVHDDDGGDVEKQDGDGEGAGTSEDKAAVRKRRVFVHPLIPRDLNDPVLKPFLDKANLVISRFIGVKGGKKRGHVVLWYKSATEAAEMADELKDIELNGRGVTVQVAEGVTVPVGTIMEDWAKCVKPDSNGVNHQRQLFVNNLPPDTPKELLRVLFPVALGIEIPTKEDGSMCGHAVLTFENKREAEISMKNATGIKIQSYNIAMHMVETDEEIKRSKEETEKTKAEEDEKSDKDKSDADKKELEKEKRDVAREVKAAEREKDDDDDDDSDNRKKKKVPTATLR